MTQFASHATNLDLISDIKFWITGSATGTTDFGINDMTRGINEYYNEVVSLIMKADGRWEWDDNNFTTLPVGTTNMVSGQADYEIASGTFLDLIRIEIKDSSGNGIQLQPISYADRQGEAMTEWAKTNGTPEYYDKVGNSIILYPTPNYSSTGGIKSYFQRPPSYFAATDNIKEPGFSPLYHRYLSMGAARDYCLINNMPDKYTLLNTQMADMRQRIIADYSRKSRDEHLRMSTYKESYGDNGGTEYTVYPDKIVW